MSNRSKFGAKPGRKDLAEALENYGMSLVLWHMGKGTEAEPYLNSELTRMATNLFNNLTPVGMMRVQAMLEALIKQETEKKN